MINVFQPSLSDEEVEAVKCTFASSWIGRGQKTRDFEAAFARHVKVDRGRICSVVSCTEGLFQAVELLGLSGGDEVVLPSISFVGAANAILSQGARPVFCDVDPRTLNPTAEHFAQKINNNTRAIIVCHYGGYPCEMDEICRLAGDNKVAVIEDCACAVASQYKGTACGTFGDIGVWSFDAMKVLSTGDGGMIYCKSDSLAERAAQAVYLGLTTESGYTNPATDRWWEFDVALPGRRAIMNDISSAIGLVQLRRLDQFMERRQAICDQYTAALSELPWLLVPSTPENTKPSYHFYWVQTEEALRDRLAAYLRQHGVYCTFRYFPLHRISLYGSDAELPYTDKAASSTLCIPMHQGLSDRDVDLIISKIVHFGEML